MKADKPPIATTHLYRGAPAVRSWSKYQATVKEWSLCGIHHKGRKSDLRATEDPARVNCPYCRQLIEPGARSAAKRSTAA